MATLNTLRTKFGFVLSVIIALALLAFIFSLRNDMNFFGNKEPEVGEINGEKISYSEFSNEYQATRQWHEFTTGNNIDDQAEGYVLDEAWGQLVAKRTIIPELEEMGLTVTDAEREAMLRGDIYSLYYSFFGDPSTGGYNLAALSMNLDRADSDPELNFLFNELRERSAQGHLFNKYAALVRGGAYVNKLEVENGVELANRTFSGKLVGKSYASVPDSLFTVTDSEIQQYYNDHKRQYKQQPYRTISYVVFETYPTQGDMEAIEAEVRETAEGFAAAEDVRAFVRTSGHGVVEPNFVSRAQLSAEEANALLAGNMYGPVLEHDKWKMARTVDSRMAPDSVGFKYVALLSGESEAADTVLESLRNGEAFEQAAGENASGDAGMVPYAALNKEFTDALDGVKAGDKVKVDLGNEIWIVDVYKVGAPTKHVNVARIEYDVKPSTETRNAVLNEVSMFAANAAGSVENFHAAANAAAVTERVATIRKGQHTISGLDGSARIVRWAFGADQGKISEVYHVGNSHIVAVLTGINNSEYLPVESVQFSIRNELLNEKKYAYIVEHTKGATLDAVAESFDSEVTDFTNQKFAMPYVAGTQPVYDLRLVGAITSSNQTGTLSAPVKGTTGVYYFTVDNIEVAEGDEAQTFEAEQVRLQSMAENMTQQALIAVQEKAMAGTTDNRAKYF